MPTKNNTKPVESQQQNTTPEEQHLADDQPDTSSAMTESGPESLAIAPPVIPVTEKLSLSALKLDQTFETGAVKKVITVIPVAKPNRQAFVRVHPSEHYRITTTVLEYEREMYVIAPTLRGELAGDTKVMTLFTAITRTGEFFLWPVKLPAEDGRQDNWSYSALKAAELAQKKWVRVVANMRAGAYDTFESAMVLSEPVWPELTFDEVVEVAFRGRYITSLDHPVLQKLRGEV